MADQTVKAISGRAWQLQADLTDELGQPAVSDDWPCVLTARLNEGDDVNLIVLNGNVLFSSVLFSATAEQMTVAAGRYLADVEVQSTTPVSTEKFYVDVEEPVT